MPTAEELRACEARLKELLQKRSAVQGEIVGVRATLRRIKLLGVEPSPAAPQFSTAQNSSPEVPAFLRRDDDWKHKPTELMTPEELEKHAAWVKESAAKWDKMPKT